MTSTFCTDALVTGTLMKLHSTYLTKLALLVGCCLVVVGLGREITAPRTYVQLALFAFGVECFHPHREFVHAPVVFFLFAERKTEAVSRGKVADDLCETGAIVAGAINPHSLAAALLGKMLAASVQAYTHPPGQRLSDRQREL